MSVIIRGMKMPKSCDECPCYYETEGAWRNECEVLGKEYIADDYRPEWCPLVELSHHGRLVDVEWLKLTIAITLEYLTRHPLMSDKEIMLKSAFKTLELMVDDAPTVIEAWEG